MFEIRFLVAIMLLAVASYFDIKERKVHDIVPLSFAGAAVVIYFFDWNTLSLADILILITSLASILLIAWFGKRQIGGADITVALVLIALIPSFQGFPLGMILFFIGTITAFMQRILTNIIRNIKIMLKGTKLFDDLDESSRTKRIAFFLVHKNKGYKFVTPMEYETKEGKKRLKTSRYVGDDDLLFTADIGKYVSPLIPLLPHVLAVNLVALTIIFIEQLYYFYKIFL